MSVVSHALRGTPERVCSAAEIRTIEQKYAFSMCVEHKLRQWLDVFLRPDVEYDRGVVSSIYYDSPALDLYAEKRNSDYLKTKVRLRWYGPVEASCSDEPVQCFLEIKRKVGAVRHKQRVALSLPATALTMNPFSNHEITALPQLLREQGLEIARRLVPLLIVRYQRRRYVDPETAARIAFDTHIGCPRANDRILSGLTPVALPAGVLEVKSRWRQLPPVLAAVGSDLRKEAFSKYALCYEALTQPLGRNL